MSSFYLRIYFTMHYPITTGNLDLWLDCLFSINDLFSLYVDPAQFHPPTKQQNIQQEVPRGVLGAIGIHKTAFVAVIFMCLAFFLLIFSAGRMHAQKVIMGRAELLQPGANILMSHADVSLGKGQSTNYFGPILAEEGSLPEGILEVENQAEHIGSRGDFHFSWSPHSVYDWHWIVCQNHPCFLALQSFFYITDWVKLARAAQYFIRLVPVIVLKGHRFVISSLANEGKTWKMAIMDARKPIPRKKLSKAFQNEKFLWRKMALQFNFLFSSSSMIMHTTFFTSLHCP